jgi:hypothetical protein
MGDYLIRTGDQIAVTIPPPTIVAALQAPVPLSGSSTTVTVAGAPVCLVGDELPAALKGPLAYTAAPFTNPGTGRLQLTLAPANKTLRTENGQPMLIKGARFVAVFTVVTPATQTTPPGPVPDGVLTKNGTAEFITTNATVQAG